MHAARHAEPPLTATYGQLFFNTWSKPITAPFRWPCTKLPEADLQQIHVCRYVQPSRQEHFLEPIVPAMSTSNQNPHSAQDGRKTQDQALGNSATYLSK